MAGVTVSIAPEILNWVIQKIQFENINGSVSELLNKWKSGEKVPTFNQIEEISRKTNIPFGYFFLDKPPVEECKIVKYRAVDSLTIQEPSRNLIDILDMMSDAQEWMIEYEKDNGQEPLSFVGVDHNEADSEVIVKHIREELDLKKEWFQESKNANESFKFLRGRLENKGIMVMMSGTVGANTRRKLDAEEFRAFTLIDKYVPLIFINTCDSENGKLFSLLHETAHIWIGVNSFFNEPYGNNNYIDKVEVICNAVAAEILVPTTVFVKVWEESKEKMLDKIKALAKYFKCSRFVIARKAYECKKISKDEYNEAARLLMKQYQEWKNSQKTEKNSGGDYYRTLGSKLDHRFVNALEQSAREGRTQYTEVYRLTRTNRRTFSRLINEIGGAKW